MAAVTAAAITAGAAAYGAYSQNKAQKEAARQQRAQAEAAAGPRTNTPYGPAQEEIDFAIEEARRLYDAGLNQQAARALQRIPGASGQLRDLADEILGRARTPSDTLAAGQRYVQDILGGGGPQAPPMPTTWQDAGFGSRREAVNAARAAGWQGDPINALNEGLALLHEQGQTPAARVAAAQPSGPFARNPIANDLYGRLGGASFDRSNDLLMQFLGGGGGAGFTPSGGSLGADPLATAKNVTPDAAASPAPAAGGSQAPANVTYRDQNASDRSFWSTATPAESAMLASGVSPEEIMAQRSGGPQARNSIPNALRAATGGAGGVGARPTASAATEIPDSMAVDSFFSQQVRDLFDPSRLDPMNDPTMQPLIDAFNQQLADEWENQANRIGDRFAGSNMFSGSGRALALGEASGELDKARAASLAQTMFGSREAALARQMQALGLVSGRDLSAMGDRTQRYGIDTSAATARAGQASAAAAAAAGNRAAMERLEAELGFRREALGSETDLATRAQNLQAILGIQGMDQFGLGMLGGLGQQLDAQQMGALGTIPGMEGIDQGWYGMGLQGAGQVSSQNAAAGRARSNAAANAALAPGADLDDYLRRIMGPAAAFSTQTGTPPSGPYYSGPSSGEALAGGLLGGAAAGLGTYLQYGGGQQPPPPTTQSYDYYGDAF